uniref:Uncharacterized protein n=1 Tax=Paraburkholderia sprentiae WSM5005 TaxID=754502 RepID=A0A1I9YT43_9BURK
MLVEGPIAIIQKFAGSEFSHAPTLFGSIGTMQRSWPDATISSGGSSVMSAKERKSEKRGMDVQAFKSSIQSPS